MEPLAWYIAGPLIGITVPVLLVLREKQLGVSSSFRAIGAMLVPRWEYFRYDWKKDSWQLVFVGGIMLVSVLIFQFTEVGRPEVNEKLSYGAVASDVYSYGHLAVFFLGALLIGFGARYADGCTAGHCIMGNAQFAKSSAVTTICFFLGGLAATYWIVPKIFAV